MKKSTLLACMLGAISVTYAAPKNIIVILADDQGYEDLSCFGSKRIKSPAIDKMASEGMKMTNFYMASSVCSPSRAALLTGRMPKRAGVPRVLSPYRTTGLEQSEITMAELFKEQGYATALIGKWHLGHLPKYLPTKQGFDYYFGFPYSNDMTIANELKLSPNIQLNDGYTMDMVKTDLKMYKKIYKKMKGRMPLMRGDEVIEYPADQAHLTQRYAAEAVNFIHENKDQPFFLYLALAMPHTPIYSSERFTGTGPDEYSDAIQEVDWCVGEVMSALKKEGLDKDTFVIYTSDNGPAKAGSAGELRGKKFLTYEGGLRVPTVIWSPGEVQSGVVCDEIVSALDLFPTFANYVGAELPADRIYDGYDMSDLFAGKTDQSPRDVIYYYEANKPFIDGIRRGDWKFLYKGERDMSKPNGKKATKVREFKPMLFNLKEDAGEKNNLYKTNPEKVKELIRQMNDFDSTMDEINPELY